MKYARELVYKTCTIVFQTSVMAIISNSVVKLEIPRQGEKKSGVPARFFWWAPLSMSHLPFFFCKFFS